MVENPRVGFAHFSHLDAEDNQLRYFSALLKAHPKDPKASTGQNHERIIKLHLTLRESLHGYDMIRNACRRVTCPPSTACNAEVFNG